MESNRRCPLGRVSCIPSNGEIEYFFNSEDHSPPHFHAKHKGGDWEIRVYFLECIEGNLAFDFKFPPNQKSLSSRFRQQILQHTLKNKAALCKEWEQKVNNTSKMR